MAESKYITLKEIAGLIEVTPQCVAKNESRWGLKRLRGFRYVRFDRRKTIAAFNRLGMLCL